MRRKPKVFPSKPRSSSSAAEMPLKPKARAKVKLQARAKLLPKAKDKPMPSAAVSDSGPAARERDESLPPLKRKLHLRIPTIHEKVGKMTKDVIQIESAQASGTGASSSSSSSKPEPSPSQDVSESEGRR